MAEDVEDTRVVEGPERRPERRADSRSLFGPVVLIALGVFFLLSNLNMLPALHWQAALRLWPLLLIFLGVNLIVRQVRPPWGTLFSGVVAIVAVALFSWVLLTGAGLSLTAREPGETVQREEISFAVDDVSSARIEIDFSVFPADVAALSDSPNLIEGSIAHRGEVRFEPEQEGNEATVRLSTVSIGTDPLFWLNPDNWFDFSEGERWRLGLSPRVPLDLRLDMSSGSAQLDLSELNLEYLAVDGSSGSANVQLPPGEYDARYEISSGAVTLALPDSGEPTIEIDGGSGSLTLDLPQSMEAQIVVEDSGSGSFNPGSRFTRTGGGDDEEGTWQTAGYEGAEDRATIILDIGSGSVSVR